MHTQKMTDEEFNQILTELDSPEHQLQMKKKDRVTRLMELHLLGIISEEEKKELAAWVDECDENRMFFANMNNPDYRSKMMERYTQCGTSSKKIYEGVIAELNKQQANDNS